MTDATQREGPYKDRVTKIVGVESTVQNETQPNGVVLSRVAYLFHVAQIQNRFTRDHVDGGQH